MVDQCSKRADVMIPLDWCLSVSTHSADQSDTRLHARHSQPLRAGNPHLLDAALQQPLGVRVKHIHSRRGIGC
jgi:hypothetical protein